MRARREGLLEALAMGTAAAGTTWVATLAWLGFTEQPATYLRPLLLVAAVVALSGAGLRRVRATGGLVVLGQVVVSGLVVCWLLTGSPLPVGEGFVRLVETIAGAVDGAQRFRAPVPPEAGIAPLFVLGGWACLVLVDALASTIRRVSLAGLPLLAIYSIPVSMLGGGVPWWAFALTAGGFLVMLYLQHSEAVTRWGRSLEERPASGRAGAVRASAGSVGAAATGLALVLPILVPTLSLEVFGFGPGDGAGGDIAVENPMTDLRRDLLRTEDVPVLRVETDDPTPSYLRIAVLNRFSDNEWSTGDRDIPTEQQAEGQMPLPELDRAIPRTSYDYELTGLSTFDSRWLPTQVSLTRISAPGDWRYDLETMDFLASEEGLDVSGLEYSFTSLDLEIEAEFLADAAPSAGDVDSSFRDLPTDFPSFVENLALEVTRDYPTRYEKAVALQDWFRVDGDFEYSTDDPIVGNGSDELVTFLTEGENGRVGYCEQFASAMAAMARSLGIPARVAVGFLEPRETGDGSYEYSSDDMHAWPELYFSGAGWVPFEPTPADRATDVPAYTEQELVPAPPQQPSDGPSASGGPSQSLGENPRLDEGVIPESQSPTAEQGFPWRLVIGISSGVLALVALLLLPGVVRRRQAAARLAGEPEPAWEELQATAMDLGVPWPADRSPRQTRDRLVPHLGSTDPEDRMARPRRGAEASPDGVEALDRLVHALERLRYSPRHDRAEQAQVSADARTVVAALRGGADDRARRRARWWPASVMPWRTRPGAPTGGEPVLARHGGVVDHVG